MRHLTLPCRLDNFKVFFTRKLSFWFGTILQSYQACIKQVQGINSHLVFIIKCQNMVVTMIQWDIEGILLIDVRTKLKKSWGLFTCQEHEIHCLEEVETSIWIFYLEIHEVVLHPNVGHSNKLFYFLDGLC